MNWHIVWDYSPGTMIASTGNRFHDIAQLGGTISSAECGMHNLDLPHGLIAYKVLMTVNAITAYPKGCAVDSLPHGKTGQIPSSGIRMLLRGNGYHTINL